MWCRVCRGRFVVGLYSMKSVGVIWYGKCCLNGRGGLGWISRVPVPVASLAGWLAASSVRSDTSGQSKSTKYGMVWWSLLYGGVEAPRAIKI